MKKIKAVRTTGGIFYCRDSAGFSVSTSNKLSCNLTGQCFEIGNKNIPPTVNANLKKRQEKQYPQPLNITRDE